DELAPFHIRSHRRRYSRNGTLWNILGGLLRFDVGGTYRLGPLLGFLSDELAEVGGRAGKHRTATLSETPLWLGIGADCIDLFVELVDDFGRRIPRCADAPEGACLIARHEIAHGRDVW